MKTVGLLLLSNPLSISLGIGAVYMAINHVNGWGWFLFAALISMYTFHFNEINKKEI